MPILNLQRCYVALAAYFLAGAVSCGLTVLGITVFLSLAA
jgi:hypothetical protein